MSGDVGSQYTPARRLGAGDHAITATCSATQPGTARSASCSAARRRSRRTASGRRSRWRRRSTLPMLFYIEDNGLGISVRGEMQTPGGNIATNLASFGNLFMRDGDGCDPGEVGARCSPSASITCAAATARRSCVSPCRGCAATPGRTIRRGYRTDDEIAADVGARSAAAAARASRAGAHDAKPSGRSSRRKSTRDVEAALDGGARAPEPGSGDGEARSSTPTTPRRVDPQPFGGLTTRRARGARRHATHAADDGDVVRFAEAVRRTLARELEVNPKVARVRRGRRAKGRRASRHRGTAEAVRRPSACSTRASPRKGSSDARSGMAIAGLDAGGRDPVPEVRRSGAPSS